MILGIDVGNTNIKYGVFDGERIAASFRVSSRLSRTADEYGAVLVNLLKDKGIEKTDIDGIIISSVIPPLNYTICHMCEYFFGKTPLMVGPGIKTGLNVKVENPKEVGADRIVNSVSAYNKYGGPIVVIDFGTATTFNVIDLRAPKSAIAKTTESNMQAGIIFGFAGLVENIVGKIKRELKTDELKVVATGGLGEIIAKEASCIDKVDRTLTLDGLRMIYALNADKS